MSAVNYDLIVIGSGPSGQRAAVAASKMKKRVVVVEARTVVGGVCVNTGTIPSKTMREAVLHLSGYNYRALYGMNYRVKEKITMADLAFRVQAVIKTEVDVTEAQLSRNGIDVVHGVARFLDPHQVRVEGPQTDTTLECRSHHPRRRHQARRLAQCPHQRPHHCQQRPDPRLPELPRSLIVVGGGVIGVEYTCMFAVLGVRVTLIEKRDRLLEFADREIIEALSYHLRDAASPSAWAKRSRASRNSPTAPWSPTCKARRRVSGDALLYAVGRQGAIDDLNLAAAGIEADNRGRIPVDEHYPTKVEHILPSAMWSAFPPWPRSPWSRGASPPPAPSTTALPLQPQLLSLRHLHHPRDQLHRQNRRAVDRRGRSLRSGHGLLPRDARGQIRGDTTGRLKLIFHRDTRKVLGVHIIGEGASELVHIGQAVMILGGTTSSSELLHRAPSSTTPPWPSATKGVAAAFNGW
jgi:NAD(P) transhydrogenase